MVDGEREPSDLARRLNHLFRVIHPRGLGEYTVEEVVEGIRLRDGPSLSGAELVQYRSGQRDDPAPPQLDALADFFGVNPAYFHDSAVTERVDAALEFLLVLRDSGAQIGCIRLFNGTVTPELLRTLTSMLERVRDLEKQAEAERASDPPDPRRRTMDRDGRDGMA